MQDGIEKDQIVYHGWMSAEQAERAGTCRYRTADKTSVVEVSMVTERPEHSTGFTDMIYMGEVSSWVSSHPPMVKEAAPYVKNNHGRYTYPPAKCDKRF